MSSEAEILHGSPLLLLLEYKWHMRDYSTILKWKELRVRVF